MISECSELKQKLTREKSLLESINLVLNEQQQAVLGNDIAGLNESVASLREWLNRFALVENERRQAMEELATVAALSREGVTLQKLLDALVVPEKEEILSLGESVRSLLEQVEKTNRLNSYLIEKSQLFVKRNLLWMKRIQSPVTTYTRDSRVKVQSNTKQLINEAV
jgi:flagellar biosynthesis/type III secretory pathway chaperone